ncbi:MAG: hypothetical protein PHS37_05595 [Candidatus Omnitrophica bacterium]|nr:hypothetical protein [Candidatus Omnitrophota bacterium]
MSRKLFVEIAAMIIIAIAFLALFCRYVPFNMDEFYQYHVIMERYYPMSVYNIFMERTSAYDLAIIPNHYLPLRSFHYTGSFPDLLYYPLFLIWKSPYSARLFGMIMLMIQAVLVNRIFKTDLLCSFITLLAWMPYAFQHIADTGPVSFQTTSVFLIVYLIQRWLGTKYRLRYPFIIGIVIFCCLWTKLTYYFLIPAIGIIILFYLYRTIKSGTRNSAGLLMHLAVMALAAGIPMILLLWSRDRNGFPFYLQLFKKDFVPQDPTLAKTHFQWVAQYITNPLSSAHRIFDIPEPVSFAGIVFIVLFAGSAAYGIYYLFRARKDPFPPAIYFIGFALTFAFMVFHPKTWAMHHIVLSYPFLALTFFGIVSRIKTKKLPALLCAIFFAVNASLYAALPHLTPWPYDHPSKVKLNEFLNRQYADRSVLVVIDWGFYFLKALYGPKSQCVVYITPFNKAKQAEMLKIVLEETGRKALFIGRTDSESDLALIRRYFPDLAELKTDFDTGRWRIWYQKGP